MLRLKFCQPIILCFARVLTLVFCTSMTLDAATTNFFEGFEAGLTNWVVGDSNPGGVPAYWGITDSAFGGEGTHGGNSKAYCAASGFLGNASDPRYRDEMSAYLTRTVSLAGQTNATLSFWYKMPTVETSYDYARVVLGTTELWKSDQANPNWTLVTISLEPFLETTQALRFEFLSDISVTNEGWYLDDITITDAATPLPPPLNDDFAAAQTIIGSVGRTETSNRGATGEVGEPGAGNSIWFRWTPYTNGLVTFRTGGSGFDTVLCVYTGSTLASLTLVGCDDNGDTNGGSLLSFDAVVGTTYSISVRGAGGAAGFMLLRWEQPDGLGQERLPDLFVWASEANRYLYGWYLDQAEPSQPSRILLRVSTATPNVGAGPLELHGSSTSPGVYQRIFRTDGSSYDRFAGNFTFHPGHGHLHFDNWINLHLRAVLTNDAVGDIIVSGDKTSFAIIDLIHYDAALPGSPTSIQYGGGLTQGLSVGWADVYSAYLQDQWIDVTDVPSGRYWLEAIVDPANSILESDETNNATRILIDFVKPNTEPPLNDHFTNATILTGVTGGDVGSNLLATAEPGEPAHVDASAASHSLWWRWTAPSNMSVTVSTDGSTFDTMMAIYTGSGIGSLTRIASDDDSGTGNNSRVTFAASAGTAYSIVVDGFGGERGAVQLHLNPAFNDAFANPILITGSAGTVTGSTRGATRQSGEPAHAGVLGAGSIWYTWAAPFTGPFTFATAGSSFDTLLAVYTGSAVNGLTAVASDNDSGSNRTSRVGFSAISNVLYRIAVDGSGTEEGVVRLAWSGPSPPTISAQPVSTNAPAGATVTFRVVASGSAPVGYQWLYQGTNLVEDDYILGTSSDVLTLRKIQFARAGGYSVVITNAYGAVTSAPANLIVLDNPRVIFVAESFGHSGGFVRVPVQMQGLGNEHAVSFSLQFDPGLLSGPRITNAPPGAAIVLDTNGLAIGTLGAAIALPEAGTFATGNVTVAEFIFVAAPGTGPVETFAGFGAAPVARTVTDTNGMALPALFVSGLIELAPLRIIAGTETNGNFSLSFSAGGEHGAGERYVVEASEDLFNWGPLATNSPVNGLFEFSDPSALPHRFYRVRVLP